jgi:hypothetical protein
MKTIHSRILGGLVSLGILGLVPGARAEVDFDRGIEVKAAVAEAVSADIAPPIPPAPGAAGPEAGKDVNAADDLKYTSLHREFETRIARGDILGAHEVIMSAEPSAFRKAIELISGNSFVVYINRLYEITKVPYLSGYQSLHLNRFVRKLHSEANEGIVVNKIKILADQEPQTGGAARSAHGYLLYLLRNPNDLQVR